MKKFTLLLLFLPLFGCNNNKKNVPLSTDSLSVEKDEPTQNRYNINLFDLIDRQDSSNIAFVSLSDIYSVSDNNGNEAPDALPNIEEMGVDAAQYFILEGKYRKRFLSETTISETDSVFIYDYSKNKLVSFLVKNLKVAAMINIYAPDWPYSKSEYMIGFEIDKKDIKGFSDYYVDVLVYVGKENPFAQEQLTPIVWKKIALKDYPSICMNDEDISFLHHDITSGSTYLYETEHLQYFLQDYQDSDKTLCYRRLLIVESSSKDLVIEKVFSQGEGTSPSPLNYEDGYGSVFQWTGKLLKDMPPVVFGFEFVSNGCTCISVIDKFNEDIYINCDNRH